MHGTGCFRFSSETHLLRGPLSSSFIHGADSLLGLLVLCLNCQNGAEKVIKIWIQLKYNKLGFRSCTSRGLSTCNEKLFHVSLSLYSFEPTR